MFLFVLMLMMPFFIGYDGMRIIFHSSYISKWKAVPLGLLPMLFLLLFSIFSNLRKNYVILIVLFSSSLISYLLSYDVRVLIVGAQLMLLVSTVEALDWMFLRVKIDFNKVQEALFFVLILIIFSKFLTDIHYYFSYFLYMKYEVSIFMLGRDWGYLSGLYQNPFSNPAFINKKILIYDFYDYFQIIFILGFFLAIRLFK
ncbi:MAG: hypothetical protein OEW87_08455, partial [Flavobacteriaceae bacterium]|nr:hypothetical protein [Flavobacteriaceae bacterium]